MIRVKVIGSSISVTKDTISTRATNQHMITFEFSEDWNELDKLCAIRVNGVMLPTRIITDNRCYLPRVSEGGLVEIGVYGTCQGETVYTTVPYSFTVRDSIAPVVPPEQESKEWWEIYFAEVSALAEEVSQNIETVHQQIQIATDKASESLIYSQNSFQSSQESLQHETNTHEYAIEVEKDAEVSQQAKLEAQQAFADLLAMLGTDVATLTNGKLTPSQIPDLSINNSFLITNESELTSLTAQVGDMAYIEVDGEVTALYWLVGSDSTILENWKQLGSSFVANAGHANTADTANNANMINNKRIVSMTESQYERAVKDTSVYYFVSGG